MERTVLIPPSATHELGFGLESLGIRVMTWPKVNIREPESFTALDEAIENLFGYDWIVFGTGPGLEFFLHRFHELGHETGELDSLRILAIGEATITRLEHSQIHVDLRTDRFAAEAIVTELETYLGGRESFRGLNFLIPRAALARISLAGMLEDAGARVDVVTSYRTVAKDDRALAQINALLAGGGIDCITFTHPSSVEEFAALFGAHDLNPVLAGVTVACIDKATAEAAARFGLPVDNMPEQATISALAGSISQGFGKAGKHFS